MYELGKYLIIIAIILGTIGVFLLFHNRIPYLGKLPGDIIIQKKNFTFYFPIVSSIIISIIISIILNLFKK